MENFAAAAAGNIDLQRALIALSNNNIPFVMGNTYFVIPTTHGNYTDLVKKYQKKYSDGTEMIQTSLPNAIAACTAARGDSIYVAPGYALTVTSSNVTLSKSGVTIIALGNGLARPTLTFGAAAATINVTAANVTVIGFHHIGNFLNVAAAYTLAAAKDFRLENNTFDDNSSALNFVSMLVTGSTDNDADGLTVIGNRFRGLATSPNAFISILAAEKRVRILNNRVYMAATNDVGHFITLSSKVMTSIEIAGNRLIVVGATNATVGIFLTGSGTTSTGIIENNYVASLDTTTELIATAGTGLVYIENYYTGTADASGKLWPIVDAA